MLRNKKLPTEDGDLRNRIAYPGGFIILRAIEHIGVNGANFFGCMANFVGSISFPIAVIMLIVDFIFSIILKKIYLITNIF